MTLPWAPPDGTEVLIKWLETLGEVRDDRPTGAVLPYRMVHDLGGPSDRISSECLYSVHTFGATKAQAQAAAMDTHRRILLLAGQFVGQQQVVLDSGQVVYVDDVAIVEHPHPVQWINDNSIHRYVGTYRIPLRFIAVP